MTPEEHIAKAEQCARAGAYTAAQSHATLAVAKMMAQMPICDHGTRGFCIECLKLTLIQLGLDTPRL